MAHETAPDAARELATLFPAPVDILIAGRLITIPVCEMRQVGRLMSLGMRLLENVVVDDDAVSLLDTHPEQSAELIAHALGIDRAWVDTIDVADRARIVAAWIRVNGVFFVHRLMPAWIELRQALAGARGAGSTSTPPSVKRAPKIRAGSRSKPQPAFSAPPSGPNGAAGASA